MAVKDVDQIRDNGGKFEHSDLSRPERSDRRKRYNEDEISREDRDDYRDTVFDRDLKASERISSIAGRIARSFS